MKKIILILISILMLFSCSKETPVSSPLPPPPIETPKISITVSKSTIKEGESITFTFHVQGGKINSFKYWIDSQSKKETTKSSVTITPTEVGNHRLTAYGISENQINSRTVYVNFRINPKNNPGDIIFQKNAKEMSENDLNKITNITENLITFENPSNQIQTLKIGDVIFGSSNGRVIARKIMGLPKVGANAGFFTFLTRFAFLAEIIKEGQIHIDSKIINFSKNFGKIILNDKDGNEQTLDDQLAIFPSMNLEATMRGQLMFGLSVGADLTFDLEGSLNLDLLSQGELDLTKEMIILSISSPEFFAGPVAFRVNTEMYARFESSLQGKISTGFEGQINFHASIINDDDWIITKNLNLSMQKKETTFELDGGIKVIIGIRLSVIFYEVAGPSVGVAPYLSLDLNLDRNPIGELYAGIDGTFGIKTGWLASFVPSANWVIPGPRYLIYSFGEPGGNKKAYDPSPENNSISGIQGTGGKINQPFSWKHDLPREYEYRFFLGKTPSILLYYTTSEDLFLDGWTFDPNSDYYWRIDSYNKTTRELTQGDLWKFTTNSLVFPYGNFPPSNPFPVNNAINVETFLDTIRWNISPQVKISDIHLGKDRNNLELIGSTPEAFFNCSRNLESSTIYYWYVLVEDSSKGFSYGPLWSFTTK